MGQRDDVRMGALAEFGGGFAAELRGQGYRPNSVKFQLHLAGHLGRWMAVEGVGAGELTPARFEAFIQARRSAGYRHFTSSRALVPLRAYLDGLGVLPAPGAVVVDAADALLGGFADYLRGQRSLTAGTARVYVDWVRPFVAGRVAGGVVDLEGLCPADVTRFVVVACSGRARGSAKLVVTALRSLLGFLHVEGLVPSSLVGAVPSVAGWRLAGLPEPLEPAEVRRLLGACDRRTSTGRRDFAVLVLLVRLGLRAGEVCSLALDDMDWRSGELVVRGKGRRVERVPLPVDVGEAVAGYLRRGRPATSQGRTVFVRAHAPHVAMTSSSVSHVVAAAARRAGLGRVGSHRLRHTAATAMIRGGASLPEVGQVLRHRRLLTTAIYAKVDRDGLRLLARPWPGSDR